MDEEWPIRLLVRSEGFSGSGGKMAEERAEWEREVREVLAERSGMSMPDSEFRIVTLCPNNMGIPSAAVLRGSNSSLAAAVLACLDHIASTFSVAWKCGSIVRSDVFMELYGDEIDGAELAAVQGAAQGMTAYVALVVQRGQESLELLTEFRGWMLLQGQHYDREADLRRAYEHQCGPMAAWDEVLHGCSALNILYRLEEGKSLVESVAANQPEGFRKGELFWRAHTHFVRSLSIDVDGESSEFFGLLVKGGDAEFMVST